MRINTGHAAKQSKNSKHVAKKAENAERVDDQREKKGRNRSSGSVALSGMALGEME